MKSASTRRFLVEVPEVVQGSLNPFAEHLVVQPPQLSQFSDRPGRSRLQDEDILILRYRACGLSPMELT